MYTHTCTHTHACMYTAVVRDMFYDGNAEEEPGAVVCRVSPSFIRFGNFEIFSSRDDMENLKRLLDFTIERDYPEIAREKSGKEAYLELLREVCLNVYVSICLCVYVCVLYMCVCK
jgi:uncharacterized protein YdiU (UPF0061 family)